MKTTAVLLCALLSGCVSARPESISAGFTAGLACTGANCGTAQLMVYGTWAIKKQ